MEEPRSKKNVARFRQGRKRNVRRKEDQPTSHKKKNGKITPGRERDPTPDSAIQPPTNQTSETPTQTCKKHSCSPNRYNPSKRRRESKEDEEK